MGSGQCPRAVEAAPKSLPSRREAPALVAEPQDGPRSFQDGYVATQLLEKPARLSD
jgi:hypothetical protein